MQKAVQTLKNNLTPNFPKHDRNLFLLLGILFFFLFILFTLLVRSDLLRAFDFNMTVKLQDKIPIRLDGFFSSLSVIGRFETCLIILITILLFKRKILGIIALALFGFAHIIEVVGKSILSQPGPPHMFLRTSELASAFPGFYIHTDASYPSGHAMRALFLSVMIVFILLRGKKLSANVRHIMIGIVIVYAVIMAVSRVSLGEHWTTDVVGGALLGLSFAFFSLLFL